MSVILRNLVLVNDHASDTGGAARVALRQARELARRGLSVHYLASVGPGDAAALPGARGATVIAGAGHWPWLDAQDLVRAQFHPLQQVLELLPRPAGLQVLDDRGLDALLSQQGQGVAGRPAAGVVIDRDVAHGRGITPPAAITK